MVEDCILYFYLILFKINIFKVTLKVKFLFISIKAITNLNSLIYSSNFIVTIKKILFFVNN